MADITAGLPLANVRPMTAVVTDTTGQPRFTTLVMSFFAGVAFLLASLGSFGMLLELNGRRWTSNHGTHKIAEARCSVRTQCHQTDRSVSRVEPADSWRGMQRCPVARPLSRRSSGRSSPDRIRGRATAIANLCFTVERCRPPFLTPKLTP